jgi:hypothetical protein
MASFLFGSPQLLVDTIPGRVEGWKAILMIVTGLRRGHICAAHDHAAIGRPFMIAFALDYQ